jgi:hypothetical protein
MTCTRCDGTGFLNIGQLPDSIDGYDTEAVLKWIGENEDHDIQICDCCGDGCGWYGTPGEHYGPEDPPGPNGPYAYNGGLCECN